MSKVKTVLRVAWAIVVFPFIYPWLCGTVMHAFDLGSSEKYKSHPNKR